MSSSIHADRLTELLLKGAILGLGIKALEGMHLVDYVIKNQADLRDIINYTLDTNNEQCEALTQFANEMKELMIATKAIVDYIETECKDNSVE